MAQRRLPDHVVHAREEAVGGGTDVRQRFDVEVAAIEQQAPVALARTEPPGQSLVGVAVLHVVRVDVRRLQRLEGQLRRAAARAGVVDPVDAHGAAPVGVVDDADKPLAAVRIRGRHEQRDEVLAAVLGDGSGAEYGQRSPEQRSQAHRRHLAGFRERGEHPGLSNPVHVMNRITSRGVRDIVRPAHSTRDLNVNHAPGWSTRRRERPGTCIRIKEHVRDRLRLRHHTPHVLARRPQQTCEIRNGALPASYTSPAVGCSDHLDGVRRPHLEFLA